MKTRVLFMLALSICLVTILTLFAWGCAPKSTTLAPADFYKSKTVDWTSAGAPGGNVDQVTRIMQPVLAKQLGTTVTVTSRQGGGGLEGHNHVWFAEADGTHLNLWDSFALVTELAFEPGSAKYAPAKFSYIIGFPQTDRFMFFVAKDSPYTTIEKLKSGKNLKMGGTSPTGGYSMATYSVASLLGLDAKVLVGLKGAADIALRIAQGEIAGAVMAASQGPIYADKLKPIFGLGSKRSPLYPDVPALSELAKFQDPVQNLALKLGDTAFSPLRAVFTGPGVPQERIDYLREIFSKKVIPEVRTDLQKAFSGGQTTVDLMKLEDFISGANVTRDTLAYWNEREQLKKIFDKMIADYRM